MKYILTIFLAIVSILFGSAFSSQASAAEQLYYRKFTNPDSSGVYQDRDQSTYSSSPDGTNETTLPYNFPWGSMLSPNGKRILYKGSNPEPWVSGNLSSSKLDGTDLISTNYLFSSSAILGWMPDSLSYLYADCSAHGCSIFLQNIDGSGSTILARSGTSYGSGISSPDGETYVVEENSKIKYITNLQAYKDGRTRELADLYSCITYTCEVLAWSNDSKTIAVAQYDNVGDDTLTLVNVDSKETKSITIPYRIQWSAAFSPDDSSVLIAVDNSTRLPNINTYNPTIASVNISTGTVNLQNTPQLPAEIIDWQDDSVQNSSVYRFWSSKNKHHFYTSNYEEAVAVLRNYPTETWGYETTSFNVKNTVGDECVDGTNAVYRFWSDKLKAHFYTIDVAEKNRIIEKWPVTWKYEAIAFCSSRSISPEMNKPVYRFWSSRYMGHFYTTDATERDRIIQRWPDTWSYEGIAFYTAQ